MKDINGTELMRGDAILSPDGQGGVLVGQIAEFYDRNNQLRIGGFPLRIAAEGALLAQTAWDAYNAKTAADAAAAAQAAAEAAAAALPKAKKPTT
jgi:hypothetical protein